MTAPAPPESPATAGAGGSFLERIGFYTLSDERASRAGIGPLVRCELLVTSLCNFKCPYCRGCAPEFRGSISLKDGLETLALWVLEGMQNVRFSGGEPTLHPHLVEFVRFCRIAGVRRIAVSTNGSAPWEKYQRLLAAGVNDFSISLDACCSQTGDRMAGGLSGAWEKVTESIRRLSAETYVTVGVVLTDENVEEASRTIALARSLGVSDVRIISAAQKEQAVRLDIEATTLARYPILRYRARNFAEGRMVRGLRVSDCERCFLVRDDMAVLGGLHFPCIIYLREGGAPIGHVGPDMRPEREQWFRDHDSQRDPICRANCLDVCIDYNNRCRDFASTEVSNA